MVRWSWTDSGLGCPDGNDRSGSTTPSWCVPDTPSVCDATPSTGGRVQRAGLGHSRGTDDSDSGSIRHASRIPTTPGSHRSASAAHLWIRAASCSGGRRVSAADTAVVRGGNTSATARSGAASTARSCTPPTALRSNAPAPSTGLWTSAVLRSGTAASAVLRSSTASTLIRSHATTSTGIRRSRSDLAVSCSGSGRWRSPREPGR